MIEHKSFNHYLHKENNWYVITGEMYNSKDYYLVHYISPSHRSTYWNYNDLRRPCVGCGEYPPDGIVAVYVLLMMDNGYFFNEGGGWEDDG